MGTFSRRYLEWSKEAQKAQIDTGLGNRDLAEKLNYSRQFVTSVVNGRKESRLAIARISKCLGIPKIEDT